MSLSYLLIAARDALRDGLSGAPYNFTDDEIEIMPGPEPPPVCGQRFISLYATSWSPGPSPDQNRGLDEVYAIACAYTVRAAYVPTDRRGLELYVKESVGMTDILRRCNVLLHQSIDVMNDANSSISGSDKIVEYLRWLGCDPNPQPVGPAWFNAAYNYPVGVIPEFTNVDEVAGLVMETRLGLARRLQTFDNME